MLHQFEPAQRRTNASRQLSWTTRAIMKTIAFTVLGVPLISSISVYADDLIRLKPYSEPDTKDVIVQRQFLKDEFTYWTIRGGELFLVPAKSDEWRIVLAPDKLDSIKNQWKAQGLTVDIEYRNGRAPLQLHNCFFLSIPPEGYVLRETTFPGSPGMFVDPDSRREDQLPLLLDQQPAAGSGLRVEKTNGGLYGKPDFITYIPLSNIETVEVMNDDSLLLAAKGITPFPARIKVESVSLGMKLIPTISGFTYEADGAWVDKPDVPYKPYFTEHSIPFSEIRKITVPNGISATTKPAAH